MDPNDLPESDPSAMNFGSGGDSDKKAWKDIWGCGQGIGAVDAIQSAGDAIARLADEYEQARRALNAA
jgi:nitronate monooxygenase